MRLYIKARFVTLLERGGLGKHSSNERRRGSRRTREITMLSARVRNRCYRGSSHRVAKPVKLWH
jgi:hypothetical protein